MISPSDVPGVAMGSPEHPIIDGRAGFYQVLRPVVDFPVEHGLLATVVLHSWTGRRWLASVLRPVDWALTTATHAFGMHPIVEGNVRRVSHFLKNPVQPGDEGRMFDRTHCRVHADLVCTSDAQAIGALMMFAVQFVRGRVPVPESQSDVSRGYIERWSDALTCGIRCDRWNRMKSGEPMPEAQLLGVGAIGVSFLCVEPS